MDTYGQEIDSRITLVSSEDRLIGFKISHRLPSHSHLEPGDFEDRLDNFAPKNIIDQYGPPDRVLIRSAVPGEQSTNTLYTFSLIYDELGFSVEYFGIANNYPSYVFCPGLGFRDQIVEITLFTKSPNGPIAIDVVKGLASAGSQYEEFIETDKEFTKTIMEAAGLTTEKLVSLIMEDPDDFCVATPREIW